MPQLIDRANLRSEIQIYRQLQIRQRSILIFLVVCDLLPSSALVSFFLAELRRHAQCGVELLIPGTFDSQISCFSIMYGYWDIRRVAIVTSDVWLL